MSQDVTDRIQANLQDQLDKVQEENQRLIRELEEQKRLEENLRESEYQFRTLADGAPVLIWVTNTAGEIEFINRAYTEFFGVTLAQVQSISWQILVHPEDQVEYIEEYSFSHKQQRPFHAQARIYRKDSQWRWVESYGQPRFSEEGHFLGMAGSSIDITDRVDAINALSESEAKFRCVFESAAVGLAMVALDGNFVDVNEAYCRILGYSRDELLQISYFQVVHPDDAERNLRLIGQLLAQEIPLLVMKNRCIRKDGQTVWIRKSVSSVLGSNKMPKWFLMVVEKLPKHSGA
jgi:PAS domain S-box-containing protein